MLLPVFVFIRRRIPNYRRKIKNSQLYRALLKKKSAEEIEQEILQRRREQIKNTIITDKSYEQFIYVNRAAAKWKKKVEMKKMATLTEKKMLSEGNSNVLINPGYHDDIDTIVEESSYRGK